MFLRKANYVKCVTSSAMAQTLLAEQANQLKLKKIQFFKSTSLFLKCPTQDVCIDVMTDSILKKQLLSLFQTASCQHRSC